MIEIYQEVGLIVTQINKIYLNQTAAENFEHAARQSYIGFAMAIAQIKVR
jgi:hypothetical protein